MAQLKSFRAEYGMSVEVKGVWHRLSCAVEVEVENGDDPVVIKSKAWNTVETEIEKKFKEIMGL